MRYFFNIRDHEQLIEDFDGTELPDIKAARWEAIQAARELMATALMAGKSIDHRSFEIRDGNNVVVAELPFKEAIPADG